MQSVFGVTYNSIKRHFHNRYPRMIPKDKYIISKKLQKKAHELIPGGCHTYAKGDDQYPELSPGFIVRGKGSHVWDVDGNEFIEYGMGLRAVSLGHAYDPVVRAAYESMKNGSNFTRPSPIETECAEILLDIINNGEQVKFAKDGSSVLTAAVKLARAYTGKDKIAICASHPFFSYNDWFIGTTEVNAGIPDIYKFLTISFIYNDISSLKELFNVEGNNISCVVMEAARTEEPENDFLLEVQRLCQENNALFILDEMITGFRWDLRGAQNIYKLQPDLSCFGKAMANGFSVSALVGKKDIMELGGLLHGKERVFLLSTTHGAENHSLAAAIKTMKIYKDEPVIEKLYMLGERLTKGINKIIDELEIREFFFLLGRPCNLVYATRDQNKHPSQLYRTLFLQEIIKRGILAPSFVVSYSHSYQDIDNTIEIVGEALMVYKKALLEGIGSFLVGDPVKPVYRKYNF